MRVFMQSMGVLCCLLGVFGGCGGSGNDGDASTPLSELPDKLAATLCGILETCLGPSADLYLRGADCIQQSKRDVSNGEFALLERAVNAGSVQYDGTKVDGCLRALEASGCDVFVNRIVSVCEGVIVGSGGSGDDCTLDAECRSGHFCRTDASCPGTCSALLAAGQSCTDDDDCADGTICSDDTARCVRPAREGESCGGASGPPCVANLGCQGATETASGTCVALDDVYAASSGASCDFFMGQLCQAGQTCALLAVTGEQQFEMGCEPPVSGGACRIAVPEQCPTGQFCELPANSVEGTCTALPGDGAPCAGRSPTEDPEFCAIDHVCLSGTCRALQALGEACEDDAQCISGVCADGGCSPSRCADPV
jgi:hypothetical protein